MSSSMGFLLSLSFVVLIVSYIGDLLRLQTSYAALDNLASSVSKLISHEWGITTVVVDLVNKEGAYIIDMNDEAYIPAEGDPFKFRIYEVYKPLASGEEILISIDRIAIIGYRA